MRGGRRQASDDADGRKQTVVGGWKLARGRRQMAVRKRHVTEGS